MRCRSLHEVAIPAYLGRFLFSVLPRVAPYCVPGGVRVVSNGVSNSPEQHAHQQYHRGPGRKLRLIELESSLITRTNPPAVVGATFNSLKLGPVFLRWRSTLNILPPVPPCAAELS